MVRPNWKLWKNLEITSVATTMRMFVQNLDMVAEDFGTNYCIPFCYEYQYSVCSENETE